MKNKGKFIAIIGPDGCGKSTVFHKINIYFNNRNISVKKNHWRPGILPYKNKFKKSEMKFNEPSKVVVRGKIISTILLIYIYIDFLLGYLLVINKEKKKGNIIYYERYFYDILVDPKRYGLSALYWLCKLLTKYSIRPDLLVVLHADGEIIHSRKKELTVKEINSQNSRIEKEFSEFKNLLKINVGTNDEDQVTKIILDKINS